MTTYEEWRVTGEPGNGYPAYDFTWSRRQTPDQDPEKAARSFIELIADGIGWQDGPHLSRRTVTETEWEPVREDNPA
jgi:hypothetical protein